MVFDMLHLAIILFLVTGAIFAIAPALISFTIAPFAKGGAHQMPYECGMVPLHRPGTHFNINYYVYAIIFIAFDVDVLYLFPVSAYYGLSKGYLALMELTYFLFFVLLALLYFRAKGVFEWPRQIKV